VKPEFKQWNSRLKAKYYKLGTGYKNANIIKMGWNGSPIVRTELYVRRVEKEPYKDPLSSYKSITTCILQSEEFKLLNILLSAR
jgi:hypothetical protein